MLTNQNNLKVLDWAFSQRWRFSLNHLELALDIRDLITERYDGSAPAEAFTRSTGPSPCLTAEHDPLTSLSGAEVFELG